MLELWHAAEHALRFTTAPASELYRRSVVEQQQQQQQPAYKFLQLTTKPCTVPINYLDAALDGGIA